MPAARAAFRKSGRGALLSIGILLDKLDRSGAFRPNDTVFLVKRGLHHVPRVGIERHAHWLAIQRERKNLMLLLKLQDLDVLYWLGLRRSANLSTSTAAAARRRCFHHRNTHFNRHAIESRGLNLVERYLQL